MSVPNVQISSWVGNDMLLMPVVSSLGLDLPVSIGVCASTHRSPRGTKVDGDHPPPSHCLWLPLLSLSKKVLNLRVKLLSQHTWQTCSFRWNPIKIKHLSIPEAGPLLSHLFTFLTCKAAENNFLYETDWGMRPKGQKPRRDNFY